MEIAQLSPSPERLAHAVSWKPGSGIVHLGRPTQVESKIVRKSEQNSLHDLLVISALQRLENTEAGHAPEGQSSIGRGRDHVLDTIFCEMCDFLHILDWPAGA